MNRKKITKYIAEDGRDYYSKNAIIIANRLLELKNNRNILNYESQISLNNNKIICDFKVVFNTGFSLFLEIKHKKKNIQFYNKHKYLFEIIHSVNQLDQIIKRYKNLFYIPIKNSIITAHINPDGDAISSCIALRNHLLKNGKQVSIILEGSIPKNLKWLFDGIELNNKISAEQIIVLDSDCSKNRLGWKIPNNIPIINIDHHKTRISEHNPDRGIYVIDSCSTAFILFKYFGIRDDTLAVGVYTDTYFAKNFVEVLDFLLELDISEAKVEEFLNKINYYSDRKTWKIIRDSKVHRCKNGFVIVETTEKDLAAIENSMHILCSFNETVCLIYGENNVKLRTLNKSLDLSIIAKKFGGGGHRFAAACNADNLIEFKDYIIHFNNFGERFDEKLD